MASRDLHTFLACCTIVLILESVLKTSAVTPLTDFMISKSVTNHGDLTMFSRIFDKFDYKRCLKITAIGGSVTEGHWNHTRIPVNLRWPGLLAALLNARFPCNDPAGHVAQNQGRGATPTSAWIETLTGQQEVQFQGVDLVLLETAVNQMAEREQAQIDAEILMSMVTKQSRRSMTKSQLEQATTSDGQFIRGFTGTAAMWVVASTRRFVTIWTGVPYERISDAMYAQLPVAQHHGVPIISAIDALGPFPTSEVQAWFNQTWYEGDPIHPNQRGHILIADLVFHYLKTAYEHTRLFQWHALPKDYIPREPMFLSRDILNMFLDQTPIKINLANMNDILRRNVTRCSGWWAYADVPEKIGFVAINVGSSCVVPLKSDEVSRLSVGMAHVLMYKSYENMGTFRMAIMKGRMGVNGMCEGADDPNAQVLGSMIVDSLWKSKASLAEVSILHFELPTASDKSACLLVHLDVVESKPARLKNKVKLLGISFF
ncbi:hypothetical protein VaNZ11_011258 [Volvox africanus]|uniref:SGNH hydrolase-type esterase domain-containing protein n=1 Tax=Volvox africanus TaxID=51714 RepID=A0ABQ5SB32_9CHLO|nr:hypothetical protein VaNZ11_011258 [Volvox africanus]